MDTCGTAMGLDTGTGTIFTTGTGKVRMTV
jgi:hypothetical protein